MTHLNFRSIIFSAMCIGAGTLGIAGQSTDQNYPTPVTSSEIRGNVRARDIGDSRLTTHFYAFDGDQGDIFINVQTRNFDGDIDIFTAGELRPLTKIVVYSDAGNTETGRVIYLRKPEHLLLRVEGRTPGDDAASYAIKFAGSFVALAVSKSADGDVPKVRSDEADGVRLNSVGAVPRESKRKTDVVSTREVEPKTIEPKKVRPVPAKPATTDAEAKETPPRQAPPRPVAKEHTPKPPRVTVTDPLPASDPLASVFLTVQLKDGRALIRPMSEVQRFSTDKGIMTIVLKDGGVARYPITDVLKVTIQ